MESANFLSVVTVGFLVQVLVASMRLATPMVLAAIGEVFAERSGVLNMGLEGMMLLCGLVGFSAAYWSDSLWIGVAAAVALGSVLGLAFAICTVSLHTSHVVTGLSFLILCSGIGIYLYRLQFQTAEILPSVERFRPFAIPLLSKIPVIGPVLFNQSPFTYLMLVLVPLAWVIVFRTPLGLRITAVGEVPQAADTLGVRVIAIRYLCTIIGGAMAGLAGAYFPLGNLGVYADSMVSGRGFIALALVVFGRWDPVWVLVGGLLFGAVEALQSRFQSLGVPIASHFLLMTPYILTLLILFTGRRRRPPAALCIPYSRG